MKAMELSTTNPKRLMVKEMNVTKANGKMTTQMVKALTIILQALFTKEAG